MRSRPAAIRRAEQHLGDAGHRARAQDPPAAAARPQPRSRDHPVPHHPHPVPSRAAAGRLERVRGPGGAATWRCCRSSWRTGAMAGSTWWARSATGWPRAGARGAPDPARDPLIADMRRLGAITGGLHAALASDGSDPGLRAGAGQPRGRDALGRRHPPRRGAATRPRATAEQMARRAGRAGIARTLVGALEALVGHGEDPHATATTTSARCSRPPTASRSSTSRASRPRPLAERAPGSRPCATWPACCARSTTRRTRWPSRCPRPSAATALAALTAWEARARRAFLEGYRGARREPGGADPAVGGRADRGLRRLRAREGLYELRYERDNRPDWVAIPLAGIRRILLTPGRA